MSCSDSGKMHPSDGIIMSIAPPHRDKMGVLALTSAARLRSYMTAMRRSKRAGGSSCGVDMVMTAEMLGEGRSAVATMPPIECPMTIIEVLAGYSERIYDIAADAYAVSDCRVGPWKADRSSLYSTRS